MGFFLEKRNYNGRKTTNAFPRNGLLNFQKKKAQLKIQQMAFMLIAVTIFFALVGMFVLAVKFSDIKQKASDLNEESALTLVSKIANAPEFACGQAFSGNKINCLDEDKLMSVKNLINSNPESYRNFWGRGVNVEVRKIFPEENKEVVCTSANYPQCGIINLFDQPITAEHSNFAILCHKESLGSMNYDKCVMARIMVEYE